MKYYTAIIHEAMVHKAFPDKPIKIDLSRGQVFALYYALEEVNVFKDPENAVKYANRTYYRDRYKTTRKEKVFYSDAYPSKYHVTMRRLPIALVYAVEGPDEANLKQRIVSLPREDMLPSLEIEVQTYQVLRQELDLVFALVSGLLIHYTEKYAEKEKQPLTICLTNTDLAAKPDCALI